MKIHLAIKIVLALAILFIFRFIFQLYTPFVLFGICILTFLISTASPKSKEGKFRTTLSTICSISALALLIFTVSMTSFYLFILTLHIGGGTRTQFGTPLGILLGLIAMNAVCLTLPKLISKEIKISFQN